MLSSDFETAIAAIIKNLVPNTTLLASVSGGADSTAMLCALAAIRDNSSSQKDGAAFDLRCIHVEHGIRPAAESRGDAEFVQSLCQKLNVPCKIAAIPPGRVAAAAKKRGIGIEAAARLYRRRAWRREIVRLNAENKDIPVRILTAHTADDMRETVLMRILRGSGPSGIAAMPVSRGRLLRPLLTLSRRDVLNYLSDNNMSYRDDSTNTDITFLRNRIRHLLIPQLNEHFPQWGRGVTSLAETQSLAAEFIKNEAKTRIVWEGVGKSLSADAEAFFAQPAIIREEALFQGINQLGISVKIRRANIRRFAEGMVTAVDLGRLHIRHTGENVVLAAKNSACEYGFSRLLKTPGSYNLKDIGEK